MMSAAVAGTTFRPTPSYTTLRDVTCATGLEVTAGVNKTAPAGAIGEATGQRREAI